MKHTNLKGLLISKGINQSELAKRLGINACSVSLKITGKRQFTLSEILKIMEILDKTFEEIFLLK